MSQLGRQQQAFPIDKALPAGCIVSLTLVAPPSAASNSTRQPGRRCQASAAGACSTRVRCCGGCSRRLPLGGCSCTTSRRPRGPADSLVAYHRPAGQEPSRCSAWYRLRQLGRRRASRSAGALSAARPLLGLRAAASHASHWCRHSASYGLAWWQRGAIRQKALPVEERRRRPLALGGTDAFQVSRLGRGA